jgi:hypothetical protein
LQALAFQKYADVKNAAILVVFNLLQSNGQVFTAGWEVLIGIIHSIPTSLSGRSETTSDSAGEEEEDREDESSTAAVAIPWPKESLSIAFNCLQLVVDEFLDSLVENVSIVQSIIETLSAFSAQEVDVNVSLTSMELLWKVTDSAIKSKSSATKPLESWKKHDSPQGNFFEHIYDLMLKRLFSLSISLRPEVYTVNVYISSLEPLSAF